MRRIAPVLFLLGATASACGHDGPTDPAKLVTSLQSVDGQVHVAAGDVGVVRMRVLDAGSQPVAGVSVSWEALAGGSLDSAITVSDTAGIARVRWVAPSTLGTFTVSAHVGAIQSPAVPMNVIADSVTSLDFFPDTVHFTAQHQARLVRVVGHDQHGYVSGLAGGLASFSVPVQSWAGDTAIVQVTSGAGSGTSHLVVTAPGVSDSVPLVLQPVLTSITSIAGLDTVNGLAVGELAAVQLTGLDSLGYAFTGTSTTVDVQVTSSDPSVVAVGSGDSLMALAPGQTTINVSAGSAGYTASLTVFPRFDVGTERPAVALVYPELYESTTGTFLTDDGTFYESRRYLRGNPGMDVVAARTGAAPWSRNFTLGKTNVVVNPAGLVYVVDDSAHVVHAIGASGVDRWAYDYSPLSAHACLMAGWGDGVIAGCSNLFALRSDGTLAWTATVGQPVIQFLNTPTQTFVRSADSVTALSPDGSVRWTIPTTASAAMADAAGNLYLTENGVRMVDPSGATRWQNPTPLAGCILATADRIIVCRNGATVTALASTDGHQLWSTTRATNDLASISGDAVVTVGAYLWKLDARTGALLGRSLARADASNLAVAHGTLGAYSLSYAHLFTSPFGPGSDWSQQGGNAGRSGEVVP